MTTSASLVMVNNIAQIKPGQVISCEYITDTKGSFGHFSNLGKAVKAPIDPATISGAPNGSFNFVCVGYTPKGQVKLVADRNVQTNISWETLNAAGFCVTNPTAVNIDDNSKNFSIRLLNSGELANNEFDTVIGNLSLGGLITPADTIFWNTDIPSWTLNTPCVADSVGNVPDPSKRVLRGGSSVSNVINLLSTTANSDCGFRPVLIYDPQPGLFSKGRPDCSLNITNDLKNIEPGEAISCEYTANPGMFGVFKNLGKATKEKLSDLPETTPDGTFYFVCVGYAPDGRKKFIADRNIQGNITWETLNAVGLCTSSGLSIGIDSIQMPMSMRLPQTVSDRHVDSTNFGEWDAIISKSSLDGKSVPSDSDVWNSASSLSWTLTTLATTDDIGTPADPNLRITRGYQDEGYNNISQGKLGSASSSENVGFRPVLMVMTEADMGDTTFPESPLQINTKITRVKPGQAITCEYVASTPNSIGRFENLGKATKSVIPDPSGTTVDGKFNFVCVGYTPSGALKFVADRNIQGGVSWETLNTAGYCTTSGIDASKLTGIDGSYMRLLSSARCNKSIMTSASEWDTLIMNASGNIGNTAISNKDVFNFLKSRSWALDTPATNDDVGTLAAPQTRVCRGYEASDYSSTQKCIFDSTAVFNRIGFRPVLIVPIDKQSIVANIIFTPIAIKDSKTVMDVSYELLFSDSIPDDATLTISINDNKVVDAESLLYTSFKKVLTEDLFDPGLNKVNVTMFVDGVNNKFDFEITKEILLDASRHRNITKYAGGFKTNNNSVIDGNVVNVVASVVCKKPIIAAVPIVIDIPKRVVSASLK